MYYYASIGNGNVVEMFWEYEQPANPEYEPNLILVDRIDETWIQRKRWDADNQTWEDVLPSESMNHNSLEYPHIDSNGTKHWLDVFINDLAEDVSNLDASNFAPANHTHNGYASSSHTHSGYASSGHTHTADNIVQWADALFGTNSLGGVEYSFGSNSGKNVLTEISNMPQGLHTVYAISGTAGNPKSNESFRFLIHKTSGTIGWILAWDAQGSLFTNYQSAANTFKGWKCVYDANPSALWTGGYYMSSSNSTPQTVKPSKKLSECRNGWVLVWSDYDPDTNTKNNTDIHHDYVFKKNCAGANWSGQCMLCDIPRYMGSNANDVDTERRILKAIYIHDDRIEGSYQGSYDERNDVVLRAVYEF